MPGRVREAAERHCREPRTAGAVMTFSDLRPGVRLVPGVLSAAALAASLIGLGGPGSARGQGVLPAGAETGTTPQSAQAAPWSSGPDPAARCRVLDRRRIHGPQGWRSPSAFPGLTSLAYYASRGGRGALHALTLNGKRVGASRVVARGTFHELAVVPDASGHALVWTDGNQGHIGRLTADGTMAFTHPLDTRGGRFFRGSVTAFDQGFVAAWSPVGAPGGEATSPALYAQTFDTAGKPRSAAVQLVDARGYRFRDVSLTWHPGRREVALVWGEFASGEQAQSRIWFQTLRPPFEMTPPRPFAVRFGDDCAAGDRRARGREGVVFVRSTQEAQMAYGGGNYGVVWTARCDDKVSPWFTVVRPDGTVAFLPVRLSQTAGTGSEPRVVWDGSAFAVAWEDRRGGRNRIAFRRFSPKGEAAAEVEVFAAPPTRHAGRYPWGPSVAWDGREFLVGYNGPDDGRQLARVACP
jgi:hypothetical protein